MKSPITLYQLIFWCSDHQREIMISRLSRLRSEEEAYDYAEFWILTHPDDIVMLVEVRLDICKHCGQAIQEQPGWIIHQWIHIAMRTYTCVDLEMKLTRAEPKGSE